MNLRNFERDIDSKILARGLDYYRKGYVRSLDFEDGEYVAEVAGSYCYIATAELEGDEIVATTCTCPYDMGLYCKHQVAMFFALREKMNAEGFVWPGESDEKPLEEILAELDKSTLIAIVLDVANRDRVFKKELRLKYAAQNDVESALKSARELIKSSIRAATRENYVDYDDTREAVKGAKIVIETAAGKLNDGDPIAAARLAIVVIEEALDLLNFCDDSTGNVGEVIHTAAYQIIRAVAAAPANDETMFDVVFTNATSAACGEWEELKIDFLAALVPLCGSRANRKRLEEYINNKLLYAVSNNWNDKYERAGLQKILFDVIKRYDGVKAAAEYMERNVENDYFRAEVIKSAIAGKAFDKALNLCLDAERRDLTDRRFGALKNWKELRLKVYEAMADVAAQRQLAKELLYDGDSSYLATLRRLYPADEWKPVLREIVAATKKNLSVYVKILLEEKLKPELLEYCQQFPSYIESYYKELMPEYRREVSEIFVKNIREHTRFANDRNAYKKVCDLIRLHKSIDKAAALKILGELKDLAAKKPRRPAFIDELGKV